MNRPRFGRGAAMLRPLSGLSFVSLIVAVSLLLSVCVAYGLVTGKHAPDAPLSVHEWGTFTSIAGKDGAAIEWRPLDGSADLPKFVEHLANTDFKGGLRGTIRMETPVLYFYSPNETSVSVHASFSKGLITEWYPHAFVPAIDPRRDYCLEQKRTEGAITWTNVSVEPGTAPDFPADGLSDDRYYAARATSADPISIETPSGPQRERFLFYRGVTSIQPPLAATAGADNSIRLDYHFSDPIPATIVFERRNSKLGYRVLGPLSDETTVAAPSLEGSADSLFSTLEGVLISQGLFPDEAHAMLETWKDSWFDEGSRVLYVVPRRFVDSVLPLSIQPSSAQLTRVFVGRLELITPATQRAVEAAFASNDQTTLARYGRFLEPILNVMLGAAPDQPTRDRLQSYLADCYAVAHRNRRN